MVVSSASETPSEAAEVGPDTDSTGPGRRLVVGGCLAALSVPLIVAVIGFRRPVWTPVLDLAMTELRVRDVGGRHSPLIGLPGRIGTLAEQGSHPGPLSFYALTPAYRLLGSSAWALQVATALIHIVAMGVALVIADRRGGTRLVVAVAVLLAALAAGYGGGTLTEPWNPYMPLLWWVVVLLAVWSVLCGDLVMLPVAVLGASFCAQTHVPYLGLTLGLGALATGAALLQWWREPDDRGRVLRWVAAGLGLGLLLWLPPTVDQLRRDPGNYRTLVEYFTTPTEEPQGVGEGIDIGLTYFDTAHLVRADAEGAGWMVTNADGDRPSTARGVVLVVAWMAAAIVAWRRGRNTLVRLHLVVGAGLLLMVLAISRIFGTVWYYLTLWGWAIGLLAFLATAWTVVDVVAARLSDERRARFGRPATLALAAVGALALLRFTVDAADSPHADANVASELAAVVDQAAEGLDADAGLATGHDGRYLITWSDALHIGSQGYGLLSELERRGFEVGLQESRRVPATAHRVIDPSQATARIHLATGVFVDRWRAAPGAVEIAAVDPRTDAERVEQAELRTQVVATLRELGLTELIPELDVNLFGAAIDGRLTDATKEQMGRMLDIGGPLAVFVVPVDAPEP